MNTELKTTELIPQPPSWLERLRRYALLVRLHRPIGILLLLWPTLWALWIAGEGRPPWRVALVFMLGVALMRSAGCAINDFADRNFDGHVARTNQRPIPLGLVKPAEALGVFVVLSLLAFGLVLFLNWQTILMSIAGLALAMVYPFTKRYTQWPQAVLGLAFGWAVPMAFMAVQQTLPLTAWLMFVATLIWAMVYDTEYAMVDREDDLKIGVKSTAILFGRFDRLAVGGLQLSFLGLMLAVGGLADRGVSYYLGLGLAALMFLRQQYLIRHREPAGCFRAFLDNNPLGMLIFLGLLLDYR